MTTEQISNFVNQNPQFDLKGAGIQRKNVNGQFIDEFSFALYVSEKKSLDKLADGEVIPTGVFVSGLGWVKTDVVEGDNFIDACLDCNASGAFTGNRSVYTASHRNVNRPIAGGISISSIPSGTSIHANADSVGTLGFIAVDELDNTLVAVTNHHVAAVNMDIVGVGTYAHLRNLGGSRFLTSTESYHFDQYRIEQSQKNDFAANMYYRNNSFAPSSTANYYKDGRYENALSIGYLKRYMPISTGNNLIDCSIIGLNQEAVTGIVSIPNSNNTTTMVVDLGKGVVGTNSWKLLNHDIGSNQKYYPFATTEEINSMNSAAFINEGTAASPNLITVGRTTALKGQPNNPLAPINDGSCVLQVIATNASLFNLNMRNTICNFTNLITYKWKCCTGPTCPPCAVGGDSGSTILGKFSGIWKIVGIHFASNSNGEGRGIRIDNIAPLLKIKPYMGQPVNNPVTGGISLGKTLIVKNKQSMPFFTHTDGRTYYQMGTTANSPNLDNILDQSTRAPSGGTTVYPSPTQSPTHNQRDCGRNASDETIQVFNIKYSATGACAQYKQYILDDFPTETIIFRQITNSSIRYLDYCNTKLSSYNSDNPEWSSIEGENPGTCPEIIRIKAKLYHQPDAFNVERQVEYYEINPLNTPPENRIPTEYYSIGYSTWGPPGSAADEEDCAACV